MTQNKHMVINFFGGPGVGKTTLAAELFSALKKRQAEVQLIGDFATECILQGNEDALKDQLFVFGNCYHRMVTAYESSLVTITDAPFLLSCIYQTNLPPSFTDLVIEMHHRFQALNVLLDVREESYNHSMVGCVHSLSESISLDRQIESLLLSQGIPFLRHSEFIANGNNMIEHLTREIMVYAYELPTAVVEEQLTEEE